MAEQRKKIVRLEEQAKEEAELIKEQGRLLAKVHANMLQNNNLSNQSRVSVTPHLNIHIITGMSQVLMGPDKLIRGLIGIILYF
jgi:hypothetical protein